MLWFKYSLIGFLLSSQLVLAEKFDSNSCLQDTFSTVIKNEGRFFGLIKNELAVSKNVCDITINFKNILDTKWKIDICREPIHIKLTSKGTQSIQKRLNWCGDSSPTDFCQHWKELKETLQDYGLIFAKGERESLKTSHGQVYCSFLLISRYIDDGYVFSKYDEPLSIYGTIKEAKASKEKPKEVITSPHVDSAIEEVPSDQIPKEPIVDELQTSEEETF